MSATDETPSSTGGLPPVIDAPPADTAPTKSKRPTTRAGRAAAAAARGQKPDTPPKRATATKAEIAETVATLHVMVGGTVATLGLPVTGAHLMESADPAGKAWAAACARYPRLARIFGSGADGLVLFRLLMIYAPIVMGAVNETSGAKPAGTQGDPLANLVNLMTAQGGSQ